jgi:hypothetical protein
LRHTAQAHRRQKQQRVISIKRVVSIMNLTILRIWRRLRVRIVPVLSLLCSPQRGTPFSPLSVSHPRQITANITLDKLLRLRKDLPTTLPVARSQEAWVRVIEPLFLPDQVVRQSLVRLGPHLIDRMKKRLVHWENHPTEYKNPRPFRRRGVYLADDEFGLLITDMSAGT